MYQSLNEKQKKQIFCAVVCVLCLLSVFLAVKAVDAIKEFSYIGKGVYASNVITVNGTGEVLAIPDVATFSFSVVESAKQMADAQDLASKKMNSVIDALKSLGVDEKDIKTTDYSSYPKYEWRNTTCFRSIDVPVSNVSSGSSPSAVNVGSGTVNCPSGKQVLTGYEVSQTITVKVRKTADAGNVLAKVGSLDVSNISGINFTVDDMDKVQAEARDKAIANAKSKAQTLSKSLGIKLSHIVNFYENGNYPMAYDSEMNAKGMGISSATVVAPLPTGENKITSNVSITYEVK